MPRLFIYRRHLSGISPAQFCVPWPRLRIYNFRFVRDETKRKVRDGRAAAMIEREGSIRERFGEKNSEKRIAKTPASAESREGRRRDRFNYFRSGMDESFVTLLN